MYNVVIVSIGTVGPHLKWVVASAEELPIESNTMDSYTVAFGIRNVTNRDAALAEAYRVLKRGGRFMCLEFSPVDTPVLKDAYDAYSMNVIPKMGKLVANDAESYRCAVLHMPSEQVDLIFFRIGSHAVKVYGPCPITTRTAREGKDPLSL